MGASQRRKGAVIERELVNKLQDEGIPAVKISRSGYTGPDVMLGDEFIVECKARGNGEGFTLLERWIEGADMLYLRRNRKPALMVLEWKTFVLLMKGYLQR